MSDQKILVLTNITKVYPGVIALKNVDISFERGKVHCLMGENGAGKSTVARILTGLRTPDEGTVTIDGGDANKDKKLFEKVAYVPQELDLFRHMTVAENLFMPFSKTGTRGIFVNNSKLFKNSIPYLEKFHITAKPTDLVEDISVSEQQLLQIARATVNQGADIIMLDEPTTSLGLQDIERLFKVLRQLRKDDKAVIFISHKIEEIFEIGDEITILSNGLKVGYSAIKDITIPEVMRQMTGRDIDLSMTFYPEKVSEETLLEVENLSGQRFSDISFNLKKGEILGFAGLIGAGRSELLQTIYGYLASWKGSVNLLGKPMKLGNIANSVDKGIVYLPEERRSQGIFSLLSVQENLTMPLLKKVLGQLTLAVKKEEALASKIVKDYDIKTPSLRKEIQFLSGGNQQKVIIGRSMYGNPKIIIFDEPTKGIDVGAKVEIYKIMKQLADKGVGIILISSELEEIMKCANRIIAIYRGKKVGEFETSKVKTEDIMHSILGLSKN
ncbi:MAG: sugar ABC transporter ATP-binding protein [Candidatus Humimicrobiaceae bacterium]